MHKIVLNIVLLLKELDLKIPFIHNGIVQKTIPGLFVCINHVLAERNVCMTMAIHIGVWCHKTRRFYFTLITGNDNPTS